MGQQAGAAVTEARPGPRSGQLLGAVLGIWRAWDVVAAGRRDHVVDSRNSTVHDRDDRAEDRMRMNDGVGFGFRLEDVEVKAPLRRGHVAPPATRSTSPSHFMATMSSGRMLVIRNTRRSEQDAVLGPNADISRRALVDALSRHLATCVDNGLSRFLCRNCGTSPCRISSKCIAVALFGHLELWLHRHRSASAPHGKEFVVRSHAGNVRQPVGHAEECGDGGDVPRVFFGKVMSRSACRCRHRRPRWPASTTFMAKSSIAFCRAVMSALR